MPDLRDLLRAGASGVAGGVAGWPMDTLVNLGNLARAGGGYVGHKLGLLDSSELPQTVDPSGVPMTSSWISKQVGVGDSLAEQAAELVGGLLSPGPKVGQGAKVNKIIAGQKAKGADLNLLEQAKQLEKAGADRQMIWDATGWFKAPDKKWRFEIDDSTAHVDYQGALRSAERTHERKISETKNLARMAQEARGLGDEFVGPLQLRFSYDELNPYNISENAARASQGIRTWEGATGKQLPFVAQGMVRDPQMGETLLRNLEQSWPNSRALDVPLKTLLKHDELYQQYPRLAANSRRGTLDPKLVSGAGYVGGPNTVVGTRTDRMYDPVTGMRKTVDPVPRERSVALHEAQHNVQRQELTFGAGGAPEAFMQPGPYLDYYVRDAEKRLQKQLKGLDLSDPADAAFAAQVNASLNRLGDLKEGTARLSSQEANLAYRKLLGETEARAVEARRNLTPAERAARPPWRDYEYWDDALVVPQRPGRLSSD